MSRIIIQAGHEGRTSGSTGASGEQAFNIDVANKLADKLRAKGFEVKRVKADPSSADVAGDWDLFLSIHYDADIYGKGGGFLDRPAVDGAAVKSKAILEAIESTYFAKTGIVNTPSRRNANTSGYYMWAKLSSLTPCVLIECGVGQHKPDDYEVLFNKRDLVVNGIYEGILKAFNMSESTAQESKKMTGDQFYTKFIEATRKHKDDVEWGDDKHTFESEGLLKDEAMIGRVIDNIARDKAAKALELKNCQNKPAQIVEKIVEKPIEVIKEVFVDNSKSIDEEITLNGKKWQLNGVTKNSEGLLVGNYKRV